MPKSFWIVSGLAAVVFLALHLEWRRHRRAVAGITIRIHVNGTRGKSSVTRLVAAILREHGIPTLAKTTGTAARLILPDGSEEPVPRDGRPNIGELLWVTRRAAGLGVRAIVFECMAVDPDLQRVSENHMVLPTITVLTNARLDHTDVQGATEHDIARAFAVRPGGTLVTADPLVVEMQGSRVEASGGSVHLASPDSVPTETLDAMGYVEHPDNVAIALEIARILDVPPEEAEVAIRRSAPDPGAAVVIDLPHDSGRWTLVNLFAANDPESTFRALDSVESRFGALDRPLLLFASRADRTARSAEFAQALADRGGRFSRVVVWGERTQSLVRLVRRRGLSAERIVDAGDASPERLTEVVMDHLGEGRTVVGVGNIVGPAHRWLEYLGAQLDVTAGARAPEGAAS